MINKVILLGRLGTDPELRYTQNRTPVCTLKIATNDRRKGADGQWTEHTEWHNVVTFGKTAENCNQYLKKGRQAFIEGRIQTRKYQGDDGKDRYWTEIIAQTVQFVGGKGDDSSYGSSSDDHMSTPSYDPSQSGSIGESVSFEDDDIPF
jgi:single-strand DNA-binding protein